MLLQPSLERAGKESHQRIPASGSFSVRPLFASFRFALKFLLPKVGLEPTPSCLDRILSPARLPFRHFGLAHLTAVYVNGGRRQCSHAEQPTRSGGPKSFETASRDFFLLTGQWATNRHIRAAFVLNGTKRISTLCLRAAAIRLSMAIEWPS
jgi:hypothetical protein